MTEEQLIDAVMEEIFIRGFIGPSVMALSEFVRSEVGRLGCLPDPAYFAERCIQLLGLTNRSPNPAMGVASAAAGARDEWLAVHEAGHAVVGVIGGMKLWGVRFYNDGFPGETLFDDLDWETSTNEHVLRREIMVDVAGNIAQMLYPGCDAPEGFLSTLYDDRTPGNRPTDFISADARAIRLANVQFEKGGKELINEELWHARRMIVEQAEAKVEQVLGNNLETLGRLARELRSGPMTGTTVRHIMGG